jgi:tetratricopeptide (TPR) repeat protein
VNNVESIRRKQLIREAEGYLDLITVFSDQWPPPRSIRDRLARRAVSALDRLVGTGYQGEHVNYLRGQAMRVMERYDDALGPLHLAADYNPNNIHVHLALGWCYKRIGRLDLAIQSLEDAMAVDPDQGIIHFNLACYWSLAKNVRLALRYLAQSFDLDPNYRDMVSDEKDFDPIREDPDFVALTGALA